ncbi:TonB-dependent hemoglobin/transferrin/lactoferrin family receptor [Ferrovibrio sp. MS7]|uniref:TonB-dependent hemoglobin/transferrin/lactoferrin family receptor n=1 Tax=Ferrovibrio plantarum TaxID=3119164 RepID=UPI003135C102
MLSFRLSHASRRLMLLALLGSTALAPLAVYAQQAQQQPAQQQPTGVPTVLDTVTSVGDRVERPVGESTSTITVIDEDKIDKQNLHRMQDLFRDEPGVNVLNDPRRAGAGSFNIRGIQDNRILMQVDGTRLPDMPGGILLRGGGFTPYTRDMVDFDSLKRVEVLRGPASASYGSDALGGVVSYVTKDPTDFLSNGRDLFYSLKLGYDTIDSSFSQTGTAATRVGNMSMLGIFTHRDGSELDSKGRINEQDYQGNNLLGKMAWEGASSRWVLTGEFFQRDVNIPNIANELTATIRSSSAQDSTERWRLSLGQTHFDPIGFVDKFDWKLYYTQFERVDYRVQTRTGPPVQFHNYRQTNDQWIGGVETQLTSNTDWFGVQNTLLYGLSFNVTGTERLREYARINAATGALISNTTADGALTPSRYFPNTLTMQGGLFGQDEIKLGSLTITPGLRADYYDMNPMPDAIYRINPSVQQPRAITEIALSPKLGLNYEFNKVYSVFAQYAHGFRAPPYDDANTGFRNTVGPISYEFIPNPNLEPETSRGVEIGTRGKFANGSSYQVSSFYNRYKNFIDMVTLVEPVVGTTGQYQAQNLSEVEIYGAELRGDWRFLPEWALNGGIAYAVGENLQSNVPINSVAPLTFTAGLGYDTIDGLWGARLDAKHVFKHDRVTAANQYKTKAYTTLDLSAYYNPLDWVTIRAGIYNLLDKSYVNFADVQGLTPSATVPGDYYQAGRSAAINVTMRW